MPDESPQDLTDAVTTAALRPHATTVDGTRTQFRNVKVLDDIARRRKSIKSVLTAHRGVFTNKIVPPTITVARFSSRFYVTRNGCTWRSLPHDPPPYRIVFYYFRFGQQDGTWEPLLARLYERVRRQPDRENNGAGWATRLRCGEEKSSAGSGTLSLIRSVCSGRW